MNIHIGCGTRKLPRFTNVDIRGEAGGVDVVDGAMLNKFTERDGIGCIYACMLLEHLPRTDVPIVLKRWYDLLVGGGFCLVSVPNFEAAARYYMDMRPKTVDVLQGILMGREDHPGNFHHSLWDSNKLEGAFHQAGFQKVSAWDWRTFYPYRYDDLASAYLPDFCKQTGTHMALNMKAVK